MGGAVVSGVDLVRVARGRSPAPPSTSGVHEGTEPLVLVEGQSNEGPLTKPPETKSFFVIFFIQKSGQKLRISVKICPRV